MTKIYVLDTNVLLHDPEAVFAFQDNCVVIPIAVVEEIDNQKNRQDEIGDNARCISRIMDTLRARGSLSDGVYTDSGGIIKVELNHQSPNNLPIGLSSEKYDNRILAVAYSLNVENPGLVKLVTKDINLRIKADAMGLEAEDYKNDKVDVATLFSGVKTLQVNAECIDDFYKYSRLSIDNVDFLPNEFAVLTDYTNQSHSMLARYSIKEKCLIPLFYKDLEIWGIRPKNKEQRFAMELLLNADISLVTLSGQSGTGKTLLALAAGLHEVVEEKRYKRLLVTRPVVPLGRDIGYLPGDKDEKLRPWMQPIFDNLEYLCQSDISSRDLVQEFQQRGMLEIEALTYIRGRTLPNQFIICDEAQNLTPHMVKTIITRVGEGSKIIFTGDPQQIDNPYLDISSNGLTYLIDHLKGQEVSGHITLIKGERSKLAELGAMYL
ncbi:PhoH family protein [Mahella australiensis]|uniref:PhoH family protein n=1 Tax=Mahella australiensis (strain DSM 15567 / CIP 107919 / 50-1 BON) TaxID=697281 RepID=F3ZXZ0_MAHA5|nr:PhoH family protein [Mahella australiensis]AEE96660.1 PhoH family protein [Mahella australiensis 50-1 BON]